ncbi:MAG: Crp/Fnr family transcriptional regulator [Leptospirillum sp.]|jgi:CRP-like cAMP-binding protein
MTNSKKISATTPLLETLQQIELFKELPPDDLEEMSSICRLRSYRSGQVIIQEADSGTELFFLVSGSVKIYTEDFEGREMILTIGYPNDFFGEMAIFTNDIRSASVSALETSTLISMEREDFLALLKKNPVIALKILSVMGNRIREMDNRLMHMAFGDAYSKIARTLLNLMEKEGQKTDDGVPFIQDRLTRQELASLSGLTRETVSRSLGTFVQTDTIRIKDNKIFLVNEARLRKESQSNPI